MIVMFNDGYILMVHEPVRNYEDDHVQLFVWFHQQIIVLGMLKGVL